MAPVRYLATVVVFLLLAGGWGVEAGADKSDCLVAQTTFGDCTGGLGIIKDLATTADQRRELCECVHSVLVAGGRVIPLRGQLLRTACGFSVDFLPTTYYFNCSQLPDLVS